MLDETVFNQVGKRVAKILSKDGVQPTPKAMGERFLMEAVELALALGSNPKDITSAVMDTISNECKKEGVDYPSQLEIRRLIRPRDEADIQRWGEVKKEIADVYIQMAWLMHFLSSVAGDMFLFDYIHIGHNIARKMDSLEMADKAGGLNIDHEGKIFKKK